MQREIHSVEDLLDQVVESGGVRDVVVQGLDLRGHADAILSAPAAGGVFLGCHLDESARAHVLETGGVIFPRLPAVPYQPYRPMLYTPDELMGGYRPGVPESLLTETLDGRIYQHISGFSKDTTPLPVMEALAQRLHDHAIDDALYDWLYNEGTPLRVVGVMGGHGLRRDDPVFARVVAIGQSLAEAGYTIATGGGPGAMEAANLGAWLAGRGEGARIAAVAGLSHAPTYRDAGWLDAALAVREGGLPGCEAGRRVRRPWSPCTRDRPIVC